MIDYERKRGFLDWLICLILTVLVLSFLLYACSIDVERMNKIRRAQQQCQIQCHPNKATYLELEQTCLCETWL